MEDNILKKQLEKLMRSNEYDALVKLYGDVLSEWEKENTVGKNTFETLKKTFTKEGKIQGLREFFEIIEKI